MANAISSDSKTRCARRPARQPDHDSIEAEKPLMLRRQFLFAAAAAPLARGRSSLTHKERVDRALKGADVDRPPFSFWHHFGLTTAESHAQATLAFHQAYRTDIVKVMSDFDYPKPGGKWYELKVEDNPFPQQIRALELIRDGLRGDACVLETIFNPWNVAQKLSSKEELLRLKNENPTALLTALDAITKSEIAHARRAFRAGAAGVLLAVANANAAELAPEDYQKFSEPFDRRILAALSGARLNFLHLHVEPPYLGFFDGFPAAVFNYSLHVSGIPIADVRKRSSSVIAGGIDEVNYRKLTADELRAQWKAAAQAAGPKFILTPGCSVPNDSGKEDLLRLPQVLGA
jgi:uroporphyrinogen decarboxylase